MPKIARKYHTIEETRPKAVRVRVAENDRNAVWFPLHRIELDEAAGMLAATEKLWADKDADRNRDFAGERRARDNEIIPLTPPAWENDRSIGIDGHLTEVNVHHTKRVRIFVPRKLYRNGGIPAWCLKREVQRVRLENGHPSGVYILEDVRADGEPIHC